MKERVKWNDTNILNEANTWSEMMYGVKGERAEGMKKEWSRLNEWNKAEWMMNGGAIDWVKCKWNEGAVATRSEWVKLI